MPDANELWSTEDILQDSWMVIKERLEPALGPGIFGGVMIGEERPLAFHP